MFHFLRQCEEAAVAPLLELARQRVGNDRRDFLDDLRRDAPTVTAMIERQLAREAADVVLADGSERLDSAAPRVASPRRENRQEGLRVVALEHAAPSRVSVA